MRSHAHARYLIIPIIKSGFKNPKPGFENPKSGFENPKPGFENPKSGFENPKPGFENPEIKFKILEIKFKKNAKISENRKFIFYIRKGKRRLIQALSSG